MKIAEIWPTAHTVQQVSRYFIDANDLDRWHYYTTQAVLFYLLLLLAFFSCTQPKPLARSDSRGLVAKVVPSDVTFLIFIMAFILMFRIPLAIYGIQNADESLWIASAKTLFHDLRPWVSADTGTGGPLIPLTLLALKIYDLPIDQGTLKIMSGAVMALSTCFLYMGLIRIIGTGLSRLAILPLAVAVAVMKNNDMIAYNSEHIVILLLCIAFVFFCRLYATGTGRYSIHLILLGFFLGWVPYAKLQGAPIAFFIGISACLIVYKSLPLKYMTILIISALLPTTLVLLALWTYGGLGDFWMSYIQNNLFYASSVEENDLRYGMKLLFDIIFRPAELHFFFYYSFTIILLSIFLVLLLIKKVSKDDWAKIFFSLLLLCVSIYCTIAPARGFGHYMLLMLVPLTILTAVLIYVVLAATKYWNRFQFSDVLIRLLIAIIFLSTSLYYFKTEFTYKPEYLVKANLRYDGYCLQGNIVAILNRYFDPLDRMALWGSGTELFEGTDFLMGTRDCASSFQIEAGPMQGYYLERYLKDLQRNKPKLFVETVSPNFYGSGDRGKSGFENFPAISNYIHENYNQEAEIGGARIFLRKGAASPKKSWKGTAFNHRPTTNDFHADLQVFEINGSFLQFKGWTVLGKNTDHQKVMLALVNKSDTVLIESYQTSDKTVVDFSPKNGGFLMSGYLGFIPLKEIPEGDYQVGLFVENQDKNGFKWMNRTFHRDSNQRQQ